MSVVIAVLNAAPTLDRCLRSIHAQEWPHEILVADGGSTDGSVAILEAHAARLAHWHSRPDRGIYDAWNQVLDRCTGEWVMFLGADDYFVSADDIGTLARLDDGAVDLISGRAAIVTPDGRVREVVGKAWDHRAMTRGMVLAHPATLHRRTLFARYGRFDPEYRIVADYDFLLRLPPETKARHTDAVVIALGDVGVSRAGVLKAMREVHRIVRAHPAVGPLRAWWRHRVGELKYLMGYRLLPALTLGRFQRPRRPTAEVLRPVTGIPTGGAR